MTTILKKSSPTDRFILFISFLFTLITLGYAFGLLILKLSIDANSLRLSVIIALSGFVIFTGTVIAKSFIQLNLFLKSANFYVFSTLVFFLHPFESYVSYAYLLIYPIVLSLEVNKKGFAIWIALFGITVFPFSFFQSGFSVLSTVFLFLTGLSIGFIFINHNKNQRDQFQQDRLTMLYDHSINIIENLIPIAEAKTRIPRYEINTMAYLLQKSSKTDPSLHLENWETEIIAMAHYVSRVNMPDYIFSKQDTLSPFEFQCIQNHCYFAFQLLPEGDMFSRVKLILAQHHEHLNGSGYPNRLCADEIEPRAHLLSGIEAYLSMRRDNSYRAKLSIDEAQMNLKGDSGEKYLPQAIEAVLKSLKKDQIKHNKEPIIS